MAEDGNTGQAQALELRDVLVIKTNDEKQLDFEVVGLVEDEEKATYAVLYCEALDDADDPESSPFAVSDAAGKLLEDDDLAQEILDDFFVLAEESGADGAAE